jgi:energy-coupling factor transporter ATP-binding protein EcfA2
MISSILIEGYRGFERFEMSNLGRVNLLVGTNNSGKTSVLEAIYLLASAADPTALLQLLQRRGERLAPATMVSAELPVRRSQVELDIAHLFYGHDAQPGSRLRITATNQLPQRVVEYGIIEVPLRDQQEIFSSEDEGSLPSRLALEANGSPRPIVPVIPLTRGGGLSSDAVDLAARRSRIKHSEGSPSYFVTTESLSGDELVAMWNKVALTPSEGLVLQALQFLDPDIERIAAQAVSGPYYSSQTRGGFIIKRRGWEQPVPIGSMGDGMWRMLAMAIAITQCKGGVLLVDEIDTGLHYTVMSQMWKLIFNAAKEFDVQVFATTHSYDCVYSLAQICSKRASSDSVTVQRIDPDKHSSVPYDEDEITIAASQEIEVR